MNIVAGEEEVDVELRPIYEMDELDELVSSRVFFPKQEFQNYFY